MSWPGWIKVFFSLVQSCWQNVSVKRGRNRHCNHNVIFCEGTEVWRFKILPSRYKVYSRYWYYFIMFLLFYTWSNFVMTVSDNLYTLHSSALCPNYVCNLFIFLLLVYRYKKCTKYEIHIKYSNVDSVRFKTAESESFSAHECNAVNSQRFL